MSPSRDLALRLRIIGVVVISLFAALIGRAWYLQVLEGPDLALAAQRNAVRITEQSALRGRILDRNGRVLVANRPSNVVAIDRSAVTGRRLNEMLRKLADLLGEDPRVLRTRLGDPRVDQLVPVPVAQDVDEGIVLKIREQGEQFPGVVAEQVPLRSYPSGPLASQLLGYVGQVNEDDLKRLGGAYRAGELVGKAGVESVYEAALRGQKGRTEVEVNARGEVISRKEIRQPATGQDVVLSIDLDVQRVAEQALAEGLAAARNRRFGDTAKPLVADAGAAVVLDLVEGSVTAMASYPTFDPALLADGVTPQEATTLFAAKAGAPFTNRAIAGQYAPGSTWKLVTAMAGLQRGVISPGSTVDDRGFYIIPDCAGRCRVQNAGAKAFGRVDLTRALAVSSDVYFYRIGAELWVNSKRYGETALQDTAKQLGFGQRTGVKLPFESTGRVPTPASRKALFEKSPEVYITGEWFTGDNVNLAIGQGELTVTPIQLASVYGAFATGRTYAWNVAKETVDTRTGIVTAVEPQPHDIAAPEPAVRSSIMRGLEQALTDEQGTATAAFDGFPVGRYRIAGKTGTAQAMPKQDTALFVALAPTDSPRYAVAVIMEQAGYGATSAAPVARRILAQLSGLEAPTPVALVLGGEG